jgi:hypothetical protein
MAQGTTKGVPIDIDPLLAADSDLLVPSQKAVKTYAQPQLNGTGFVKATGTVISYDNSTYLTSVGTGVTNEITYWSGTNTIGSLATATYPSLTELSYVKGVTSAIQTQINNTADSSLNAYQALGSQIKAQPIGINTSNITTTTQVTSGNQAFIRFIPIWLQTAQTLTGVIWYQGVSGVYTASNENRVGLYTYSAGTATLVASSANDANLWAGTANTFVTKAFSSPYVASPGFYYIALLMSTSATTTSATIGASANLVVANAGLRQVDFTNGALTYGVRATVLSLPGSITVGTYLSALTQNMPYAAVY